MTEEESTNLKDEVKKLNENFSKLLESGKKVKAKKLSRSEMKKGMVRYIFINENGTIDVKKVPIDEGTTFLDKTPRLATADYQLTWDGQPTIIQPAISAEPFSPKTFYERVKDEKMLAVGYKLLAHRAEMGQIKGKKSMPGWIIFAGIIALIVVGYLVLA